MIRIKMSPAESDWLFALLQALPTDDMAHTVLDKLSAARSAALLEVTCPVCQQPFRQLNSGRHGRYCSGACRQKAYRQRLLDVKRSSARRRT